jgi:hypothetical protein
MASQSASGWQLLSQSWSIVRQDKTLLLFPIMSALACLVVAASFLIPVAAAFIWAEPIVMNNQQVQENNWQNILYYVLLFAFYFANYLVIVFFNTALVSCALMRFTGGAPTVGDGLRTAWERMPQILGWALLSATVGMALRALEERLSFLGRFVVGLIGVAWSIAAYFVIPVLAVEKLGPFAALRRSATLLRKSWGQALVGGISLNLASLVLAIPGILLIGAGVFWLFSANPGSALALCFIPIVLGVIYLIGLSIIVSTLQQIFLAGVYLYAAEGRVADGFSEDALISAFKVKE